MKENDVVIGIDLGSYYSSVSIYEIDSVKIIPNSEGSLSTPSIVSFTKDGIKDIIQNTERHILKI